MRNLFKFFVALTVAQFVAAGSNAQSTTRPWLVGVGANAVDFHAPNEFGDIFETDYWNSVPALAHLIVGRNINPSLAADLQLGGARITNDSAGTETGGMGFFNANLNLRYKFANATLKSGCL